MIAELFAQPWWFWLALGGILLAAEMVGASGYLLWSGVAALLVSLFVWLVPMPWEWQGLSFAILTVLSALWWYRWLKRRDPEPSPSLNQRGKDLIGRELVLSEALVNGVGHLSIGESGWRVQADEDLPAGTPVTIVAIEGVTLRIVRQARIPGGR